MELWKNIPFFSIILSLASAAFTSILPQKHARRTVFIVISSVFVMSAYFLVRIVPYGTSYCFMMGHFPAPWGNEIRAGVLEALTALFFSGIMLLSLTGGLSRLDEHIPDKQNLYYVMLELLLTALLAQVYSNDLFTCYVFVEIMTIAACSLITSRSIRSITLVAAMRYMIMNLLGSGLFLLGITLLYDLTGHLLMSNIQEQVSVIAATGVYQQPLTVVVVLFSIGLAIKSALFPFHTWLPDAYGYSTPTSSAVLSSLVSKGYIFLLIKIIFRTIGFEVFASTGITDILFLFGLVGIIMGSLSAIREKDIRRMISFSSVAQIGYIFMGLGMGNEGGMVAAIFHIFAHASAKSMLFLSASGLIETSGDSKMFRDLRGAGYRNPWAGVAFSIGSFSMVGIPFLGGFISKLYFATSAMSMSPERMMLVMLVLAASTVLNTIYFLKTVVTLYRPPIDGRSYPPFRPAKSFVLAMICLSVINIALGVCSEPIIEAIRSGLHMFA